MSVGLIAWSIYTTWSDVHALRVARATPSCSRGGADLSTSPNARPCAVSAANVVFAEGGSGSAVSQFSVTVKYLDPPRRTETIAVPGDSTTGILFQRLRPSSIVYVQRFTARGYHISGRVIAITVGGAVVETLNGPRLHMRWDILQGVTGIILLAVLYRTRHGAREPYEPQDDEDDE